MILALCQHFGCFLLKCGSKNSTVVLNGWSNQNCMFSFLLHCTRTTLVTSPKTSLPLWCYSPTDFPSPFVIHLTPLYHFIVDTFLFNFLQYHNDKQTGSGGRLACTFYSKHLSLALENGGKDVVLWRKLWASDWNARITVGKISDFWGNFRVSIFYSWICITPCNFQIFKLQ